MQVLTWHTLTWSCKSWHDLTSFYRVIQVFTGSFNSLMVLQGLTILTVLHCIKRLKSFCRVLQVFTRTCKLQILPQGFVSLQGLASSYKSYKVLQVVKLLQTIGQGVAPPCLYRVIVLVFLKQSLQSNKSHFILTEILFLNKNFLQSQGYVLAL